MRSLGAWTNRLIWGGLFILAFTFLLTAPHHARADATQQCSPAPQAQTCGTCCGGGDYGVPRCAAGYSPYDDYCLPDCPTGFVRYPGMPGLCLPPWYRGCGEGFDQVPLPYCPPGTVRDLRDPDRCVADPDYDSHVDACPNGMSYSYDTGRCEADCPLGFTRNERGLCESNWSKDCPKDFVRDPANGRCMPPGVWPPNYNWVCLPSCPAGTVRDIRHPTLCVPPPSTCPEGFENDHGRCLPICDKGLQRDSYGYCVPQTCPDGSYPNLRGQCQTPDCPQGLTRNERGRCVPPPQTCDQGQERFQGQCVPLCAAGTSRNEDGRCVPDRPTCDQGQRYNPDTRQCEQRPPSTPTCKGDQVFSSSLKMCVDPPPPVHCDRNQHKDRNGNCVDNLPPPQNDQPDCPRGFKPDGNGNCTRVFVPKSCPDGTFLNRRNGRCTPMQLQGEPALPDYSDQPPPLRFNPNMLRQIMPQGGRPNIQMACPPGSFRDGNGRCIQGKP